MTLAELRALLATAACVALAGPAMAQDEDAEDDDAALIAADAPILRLAEPPPAGEATFAAPGGLDVLLMTDEAIRAAVGPIAEGFQGCVARQQEFETILATLPEGIEAVFPRPPLPAEEGEEGEDGEDDDAEDGEEGAGIVPGAPGDLPPTSAFEDPDALVAADDPEADETEGEGDGAADGETTAEGEDGELVELEPEPSFYGLREIISDSEIHPDTAEDFDALLETSGAPRMVFGIHEGWALGIVDCALDVDVALGHLEREAMRRGFDLPAAEALSERVATFDNEAREFLPPPPPGPEPEATDDDADEGEAGEGEDGEETEGDEAEGEDGEGEDG